jgi:outer membrane protein TolC
MGRPTAHARYLQARSTALPQVSLTTTYTRQLESIFGRGGQMEEFEPDTLAPPEERIRALEDELPNSGFFAIQQLLSSSAFASENSWNAALGIRQKLLQGGSIIASIQGAGHALKSTELALEDRRAEIILRVREAYLDALLAERGVRIAHLGLEQAENQLQRVRLRRDAGQASEFELLGAEVQRDNAVPPLRRAEAGRELVEQELRRLCNLPVRRPLALTTPLLEERSFSPMAAVIDTTGMVGDALASSGLRALENFVEARGHAITVARAAYFPEISLFANVSQQAYPDRMIPERGDWRRDKNVGIVASWTLFDGLATHGAVEEAAAARQGARLELQKARELVRLAVIQGTWDLRRASAELEARGRTVELARRALDLAGLRYEEGASDALELQDARISWQMALSNEAAARRDAFAALAQLERYTGRSVFSGVAPPESR